MPPIELSRLPPRPVTRFAPSPTGYLHLGHVANAVWTWGVAQATGGRVLLRIEDHDRGRCRPEFERAIVEDLEWLGLAVGGERRVLRQSDQDRAYGRAALHLGRQSPVYACRCSRADIAGRMRADGMEEWDELRYPGTCRALRLAPADGLGLRVTLGEEAVEFDDLRLGPQRQVPAQQCGDLLLRDATGNWTYQLCVAVDDTRQAVNLVIRGEDLLASTGRQIMLADRLGRKEPPLFLHHPLINDPSGKKLSKRDGSTGVRVLRAAGSTPEAVLGEAAFRTGLVAAPGKVSPGELGRLFRRAETAELVSPSEEEEDSCRHSRFCSSHAPSPSTWPRADTWSLPFPCSAHSAESRASPPGVSRRWRSTCWRPCAHWRSFHSTRETGSVRCAAAPVEHPIGETVQLGHQIVSFEGVRPTGRRGYRMSPAQPIYCEQIHPTLAVRDVDAAVGFYTAKLGFLKSSPREIRPTSQG